MRQLLNRIASRMRHWTQPGKVSEVDRLTFGWDRYARHWSTDQFTPSNGTEIQYIGDEWHLEADSPDWSTYGLSLEIKENFQTYLEEKLLDPHLPADARVGLEIGSGAGRMTALLLPRTAETLHAAEPSAAMIRQLQERFANDSKLVCHQTDGLHLPNLPAASLDYALSFDVFVHFEPRLTFAYLRQIHDLLKPGGVGVLHYGNLMTGEGWKQFMLDVDNNIERRVQFDAFGVMCPPIMESFLQGLGFEIVTVDAKLIPRDAVAVFRRPVA